MRPKVEGVECKGMAIQIRQIADEVEAGNMVAFAFVSCDSDGSAGICAMVDQRRCEHDLLDEMVDTVRTALFDSYEAE